MELFDTLKLKKQKHIIEADYLFTILNMLQSMIKINITDCDINPNYLMIKLWLDGRVGLYKTDDKIILADSVSFSGVPINDIVGNNAIWIKADLNNSDNYIEDWKNSTNFAIIGLNPLYEPDMNLWKFSELFTEIDISMLATVKSSRKANIIKGKNSKEVAQIREVLNKVSDGDTQIITDESFLNSTELDGTSNTQILELFNPNTINTIQYLSVFANDCRNRLYNIYGLRTIGSDKVAQQSEAEVNNGSGASFILPMVIYNKISEDVAILNKKFNTNWTVSLNPIIENEYNKFIKKESESDATETISDKEFE